MAIGSSGKDNGKAFGFSARDAARIKAQVLRGERYYQLPPPQRSRGQQTILPGVVPCKLPSGGIAAGSVSSPTSATVNLYLPSSGGPALVADTATTTIHHTLNIAVPSGSPTGYVAWFAGFWYLVSWDGC